eukprot:CAMPEP_0179147292 /NCGR_PEP_ID=MMETSP0796-20121207/71194_1 /TAXON_ID=73915 /ORGANISM="Pyrodinium bahamense, Strain pbaha01" /LENGTH=187 /DNA_ID=CAMNT_0020847877 /DNA_START=12 /DNA_END=571 /DNA_ORIENTATION=+
MRRHSNLRGANTKEARLQRCSSEPAIPLLFDTELLPAPFRRCSSEASLLRLADCSAADGGRFVPVPDQRSDAKAVPSACPYAEACKFCHFPHTRPRVTKRPGKARRDRYRRQSQQIVDRAVADPAAFDVEAMHLPRYICENRWLIHKIKKRIQHRLEDGADSLASANDRGIASSVDGDAEWQEDFCL